MSDKLQFVDVSATDLLRLIATRETIRLTDRGTKLEQARCDHNDKLKFIGHEPRYQRNVRSKRQGCAG